MNKVRSFFHYYLEHQNELVKKYNGRHLVITKDGVVADFDNEQESLRYARDTYGFGNFCLQLCTPGTEAYTIRVVNVDFTPISIDE